LKQGNGAIPDTGFTVKIDYVGTLGPSQQSWTVDDVVECWLKNQQGLDTLIQPFRDNNVDGQLLFNADEFSEHFVSDVLGVSNRIQCKKIIMAAKRLRTQQDDFPEGTEFDSGSFEFVLGKGKAIKAMEMLVTTMKVGEKAEVFCRADFAYGAEGYRTKKGDVVVPPFATLKFGITLLSED